MDRKAFAVICLEGENKCISVVAVGDDVVVVFFIFYIHAIQILRYSAIIKGLIPLVVVTTGVVVGISV